MDFPAQTPEQLGRVLKGFRQQRQASQQEVAARVGLAQKVISTVENHPEKISVQRLFQILSALGVELVLREKAAHTTTDW